MANVIDREGKANQAVYPECADLMGNCRFEQAEK